jgi:hypothetical protein
MNLRDLRNPRTDRRTSLQALLSTMLGEKVWSIDVGLRESRLTGNAVADQREWVDDGDLCDLVPVTPYLLKDWANRPSGIIVDLYVYGMMGLITNVCLAVAADGEILYLDDSVTERGMRIQEWLLEC